MKEKTKAYAAGLLDAEGSCYIAKCLRKDDCTSYNPEVTISSNHLPTLKWVVKHFGGVIYGSKTRPKEYNWKFSSQAHAGTFLEKLSPYIVLKKPEASVIREYISLSRNPNPEKREQLYLEAKTLNSRTRESVTTTTQEFLNWNSNLINAYTAGLLDGDGWVSIVKTYRSDGKPQYYRVLAIEQQSIGLAELVQSMYGGTIVKITPRDPNEEVKFRWTLRDVKKQERFLLAAIPYMIEKRERAKTLLEMVRLGPAMCPEKRHKLWDRMRVLNQKQDRV